MTKDEALKLVLEALENHIEDPRTSNLIEKLIAAIKEALAQPEQEPVAWVYPEGLEALKAGKPWTAYGTRQEPNNTALYLSPQPEIPPYAWVTFTPYGDEDDVWYENPEGQLLEGWTYKPLYDTTPTQRPWVGLDNDDLIWIYSNSDSKGQAISNTEAKLKEKNG